MPKELDVVLVAEEEVEVVWEEGAQEDLGNRGGHSLKDHQSRQIIKVVKRLVPQEIPSLSLERCQPN